MNVAFRPFDLVDPAMEEILQTLPQTPSANHRSALRALLETFEKGLTGRLDPGFHLSSLDPGMGKSTAVIAFLKAWKASGFQPAGSVLLAVASIKEIEDYVRGAELSGPDLGVLTANKDANGFGCPEDQHNQAPILITTQQMVRKRTRNRTLGGLAELQFHGARRSLVIWDESLDVDEWPVVRLDDIAALPRAVRSNDPTYISKTEAFWDQLRDQEAGPVTVPEDLTTTARQGYDKATRETIRKLSDMAGGQAVLHKQDNGDHLLIEDSASLPSDLAPLVILDASGRVRETYRLWEEHRGDLHRLPEAPRDYSNLTVHVWQRASGKGTLQDPKERADIEREVASVIEKFGGDWLLVHHKDRVDMVKAIRDRVRKDAAANIHAINWGRHRASNDHRDIIQIVTLGQLHYSPATYLSLACGAAGKVPKDLSDLRLDEVRWGELQHHLLQAVCRTAIRNGDGTSCHAFVICSMSPQALDRVQATFPGATVVEWALERVNLNDVQNAAIAYLKERFAYPEVETIPKKEVRENIGAREGHFARDILKAKDFQEALEFYGLTAKHHDFRRRDDYQPPNW
jgi:hypothetical protein